MNEKELNIEQLYELIGKELDGSISADEQATLSTLKSSSEEYQKIYDDATKIWSDSENSIDVDTNAAWNKLNSKIEDSEKVIPMQKQSNAKVWLGIAATLLIGFSIFNIFRTAQTNYISKSTNTGESLEITLPDGSTVSLYENSKLTYPSAFESNSRKVELKGTAFFDVERNENKPFQIKSNNINVEVLGTSFLVQDSENTEAIVSVRTGKVKVQSNKNENILDTIIKNESIKLDISTLKLEKVAISENVFFEQTKTLVFNKTSLEEVVNVINNAYEANITIEENLQNCKLTSTFKNLTLDEVLEIISTTLKIEYQKENDTILFKGNGC